MEKVLKVFTYINSELKKPFPNEKEQIEISAFVYSAKRMGAAPSISATIKHAQCLDELWTGAEYVEFRGEKYFLRSTPTSSYDNTDVRYKHECYFQSERILLENVYYYDVVSTNNDDDKPTSNNTNFSFFGTIFEFVKRINSSLKHSGITGYNIVVDEDVEEDEKNLIPKSVSFQNQFIGNVIQEIYNTYKIPYYFVGKTIHVGFHEKRVPTKLKYGINDSLLSITKTNANNKIVNRITATGSTENIPYYYPNESSKGQLGVIVEKGDIAAQIINPEIFAQTVSTTEKLVYSKNDGLLETALDSLLVRKLSKNNSAIETIVSSSDPSKIEYKGVSVQDGDYVNIIARARFGAWSDGNYSFEIKKGTADSGDNVAKIYKIEISTIYDDSNLDSVEKVFDYGDGITDKSITVDFDFKHALIGNVRFFEVSVYMNQTPNSGTKELSYSNTLSFVGKDTSLVWKNESRSTKKKDISDYGLSISGTPSIGDTIGQEIIEYIIPQPTLMPPLYRTSIGRERFYNAVNDTYEGFHFDNPFIEGRPSEYIVNLDHIKPTIEGMEVKGLRIDMFSEFAYDDNDNDEFVSDGGTSEKLLHPYFFGKLRKMDFNLFDHAIESGEMTVAMTSGACASCNFVIQVDSPETQKNSVQVNSDGTLKKDEGGNVVFGKPQDQQNDTINNEVWIALKKEQSTFGIVMPNYSANYKPKASSSNNNDGDTFVFLNINLPQAYIYAAERKLEHEMLTYMSQNNSEKFNFSIKFSRIFLEENQDVFENLTENSTVTVEYNGNDYGLYVSSYTYRMNNGDILPEIVVELFDTLAITQNVIQKAVSEVKSDLLSVSTVVDAYKSSMSKSIRKDKSDSTPFKLTTGDMLVKKRMPTGFSEESGGNLDVEGKATVGGDTNVQGNFTVQRDANIEKNLSVEGNSSVKGDMNVEGDMEFGSKGNFAQGVKGSKIWKDDDGNWHYEGDFVHVRKKFTAKEVQIEDVHHIGGQQILSAANMRADFVVRKDGFWRCFFLKVDSDGRNVENRWRKQDQAFVNTFNITKNSDGFMGNHYLWRLVVNTSNDIADNSSYTIDGVVFNASEYHFVDLSEEVCGVGSDAPMSGDDIVQLGHRGSDKDRQNAIILAGAGSGSPYIIELTGITDFSLPEPDTQIKPGDNRFTGKVHLRAGSEIDDGVVSVGRSNLLMNTGFRGQYVARNLEKEDALDENSEMWSPSLEGWSFTDASVINDNESMSTKACKLSAGTLTQTLVFPIKVGLDCYFSFKAKGTTVMFSCGGYSETIPLSGTYQTYRCKFRTENKAATFALAGTATLCELFLECGNVPSTSWEPSPYDNNSSLDKIESLRYLSDAIREGSTTILGGLVLSNIIEVGNYVDGVMKEVTGGISGVYNNKDNVAFFAGGTLEKAVRAVNMFKRNPHYVPTDEEWEAVANAVITHGGRAILNDIILRGSVYAESGYFKGELIGAYGVFDGYVKENYVSIKDSDAAYNEEGGYYELGKQINLELEKGDAYGTPASIVHMPSDVSYIGSRAKFYEGSYGLETRSSGNSPLVYSENGIEGVSYLSRASGLLLPTHVQFAGGFLELVGVKGKNMEGKDICKWVLINSVCYSAMAYTVYTDTENVERKSYQSMELRSHGARFYYGGYVAGMECHDSNGTLGNLSVTPDFSEMSCGEAFIRVYKNGQITAWNGVKENVIVDKREGEI